MIRVCAVCDYQHQQHEQILLFVGLTGRPAMDPAYCPRCDMPWKLRLTGMGCPMCGAPTLGSDDIDSAICGAWTAIDTGIYTAANHRLVVRRPDVARLAPRRVGEPRRRLIQSSCTWAGPTEALIEWTDPDGVRPSWAAE